MAQSTFNGVSGEAPKLLDEALAAKQRGDYAALAVTANELSRLVSRDASLIDPLIRIAAGLKGQPQYVPQALDALHAVVKSDGISSGSKQESVVWDILSCARQLIKNGNPSETDLKAAIAVLNSVVYAACPYGAYSQKFFVEEELHNLQKLAWKPKQESAERFLRAFQ